MKAMEREITAMMVWFIAPPSSDAYASFFLACYDSRI